MKRLHVIGVLALLVIWPFGRAAADEYAFRVVASGLSRPTGITIEGSEVLYFTQVPTPGVPGANSVNRFDLETGETTTLHMGEPEPRNIVQDKQGNLYWTCTTAGVILRQTEDGVTVPLLSGLMRPIGIATDRQGNIFYTEVPMPGVAGGTNRVSVFDGTTIRVLHMGEPEPVDIAVTRNGDLYWTCRTAGVILKQSQGATSVFLAGLDKPVGIAVDHKGERLYFTEVPTPGVSGSAGGRNKVWRVDLRSGERTLVHAGDPEPTDVTVARNGNVYWTCTSAGVIVEARRIGGR
jgi:DNA-binding beta-propeller fold protein YncE